MTRIPFRLGLLSAALLCAPLRAEDPGFRELLRDALYTEEVTRDAEAAAKQYEEILSRHDEQRAFAASALFRLAEVRRKQDRKDDAIALYQQLLGRFPEARAEAKLARENLATMGSAPPENGSPTQPDSDEAELKRLQALAETSPDQLRDPQTLRNLLHDERIKVVEYLLSQGADPHTPGALSITAEKGNLSLCMLLLQHGKPSPEEAGKALAAAIRNDRMVVLTHLLDQKLSPNGPVEEFPGTFNSPLTIAVETGRLKAASLLLDHKADLNFVMQSNDRPNFNAPFGTPLHVAVISEQVGLPMIRLLLERGADPNVAVPDTGLTPLHFAAFRRGPDSEMIVKELLAKGADPNRRSLVTPPGQNMMDREREVLALATPFEAALRSGSFINAEAMLANGADPNAIDNFGFPPLARALTTDAAKLLRLLLENGADPNKTDREGRTALSHAVVQKNTEAVNLLLAKGADPKISSDKDPILAQVASDNRPETLGMLKSLLQAGADPNLADQRGETLLQRTAGNERSYETMQLLVEHGARPPEEWIKAKFDPGSTPVADRKARGLLIRHFLYPQWAKESAVRLTHPDSGRDLILAEQSGDAPVPQLARLLIDRDGKVEGGPPNRISGFVIHRSDADGSIKTSRFAIDSPEPYPELQWGDVVEVDKVDPDDEGVLGYGWHPETRLALYGHLSFPVTVELPDSTRKITIRGSRLTYDPATDEAPWVGAGALTGLLWSPSHSTRNFDDLGITVARAGWPDVRLNFKDPNCQSFPLQPGDTISLKLAADFDQRMATERKTSASLRIAGGAVTRCYGNRENSPFPTLAQAITDAYAPWDAGSFDDDHERQAGDLVGRIHSGYIPVPVDIPRPDFSNIRLCRLDASGAESVTTLDWEKLIRESGGAMTAAEAKGHDIVLKAGDIVELPLKEDRSGEPWKGFTPEETRFFSLALASRFQVVDGKGSLQLREFQWSPPEWKEEEGHLLPYPPRAGYSSARASRLKLRDDFNQGTSIRLVRGESTWDPIGFGDFFVRDGDQISRALLTRTPR